jgi:hypothetical protein
MTDGVGAAVSMSRALGRAHRAYNRWSAQHPYLAIGWKLIPPVWWIGAAVAPIAGLWHLGRGIRMSLRGTRGASREVKVGVVLFCFPEIWPFALPLVRISERWVEPLVQRAVITAITAVNRRSLP